MNREMRRLVEREERRSKKQQKGSARGRSAGDEERKSLFGRILQFLREVRQELRRVAWPSRDQMVAFTTVTVITTTVLTLYVFGLDFVLKRGVLNLLEFGS